VGKDRLVIDAVIAKLCKYMGEKNLTQYRLAQLSNLPFGTVKNIMQRRTKGIELKTLIMLADGLGITPSEFINDNSFLATNLDLE
jgi:transcriptional regulator with XRE-family HTH domain